MGDVAGSDKDYLGQIGRLGPGYLNLNPAQKTLAQTAARENFIPGRIHQQRFVSRYKPKVITVGIGGNDAGFMSKLRTCIGLDTCEWATSGRHETAAEVAGVFPRLVNTYTELHKASPGSKIYVIGYPKVIDQNGNCSVLNGLLLNPTEREFMNKGIEYINAVVQAAAKKAGVAYIAVEDVLGGHVLCGSSQPTYMNDITLGDDNGPGGKLDWIKVVGQESFHPRPEAHQLIAERINTFIPNLQTYNYCTGGKIICPTDTKLPRIPDYWSQLLGTKTERKLYFSRFAKDAFDDKNPEVEIALPSDSLQAGSSVSVELHSDPQTLASLMTDNDGGLISTLTLPVDTPEGFHTLHILGTAPTGELIDYYQVISYVATPKPIPIQAPTPDPEPTPDPTQEPAPTPDQEQVPPAETSIEVKQSLDEPQAASTVIPIEPEATPDLVLASDQQISFVPADGYAAGDSSRLASTTLSKTSTTEPKIQRGSYTIQDPSYNFVWIIVGVIVLGSIGAVTVVYIRTHR
jgi:lysophospholipase L1-like esterase